MQSHRYKLLPKLLEKTSPLRKQLDPSRMVENLSDWMAESQPAKSGGTVSARQSDDGPFGLE